jgi:hypothetical protein
MLTRSVWYYKSVRRSDKAVRRRIVEIANTRIRYGVNRSYVLLRREGWKGSICAAKDPVEEKLQLTGWNVLSWLYLTNVGRWFF